MFVNRLLLVFIIGSFFLSPSLLQWISHGQTDWYRPYLLWIFLIALLYWTIYRRGPEDLE
jgi:hypothetical protein